MEFWATIAIALTPLAWLLAARLCRLHNSGDVEASESSVWAAYRASLTAATVALLLALSAGWPLIEQGHALALHLPAVFSPNFGALVRVDTISFTMASLVSFIGVVVLRYSQAYLAGDPRQLSFMRSICRTVAAVSLLAIAGNAWLFLAAWVAMSLSLHKLLTFRFERRGAQVAARKKFLLARLGDAALGMALLSLGFTAGTADLQAINQLAAQLPAGALTGPALLLAFAAILKSAQFPVHGWLTEVMEAPTPVSALLHAGVVNAGGFLLVRFADVVAASGLALYLLLIVGGFTALFGSLVMLTQRSVKTALAYSTIAQMGFMLLQCGLGAFSSAMLHIVAHSVYKAHAFLSSSSIVDLARGSGAQGTAGRIHPALVPASLLLAAAVFLFWSSLLGVTFETKPAIVGLGAVLLFGMVHLVMQSARGTPSLLVFVRVAGTAAVVGGLYFTLQALAALVFESALPASGELDAVQWVLMTIILLSFAAVTLLQWALPALQRSPRSQALWVHLSHGFYVNQLSDQLMRTWRTDGRSPS